MWPKYTQKPTPVDLATVVHVMYPDGLPRRVPRGWGVVLETDLVMPCDMAAYKSATSQELSVDFISGRDYDPTAFLHTASKVRYDAGTLRYADDKYLSNEYVLFLRDLAHYNYIMARWNKPADVTNTSLPSLKGAKKLDPAEERARREKAAELKFFFGCKPSDPDKLPPPPKVLGMTWDELADY